MLKLPEACTEKHVAKLLQRIHKESLLQMYIPYGDLVNPDALKIVKELSGILVPKLKWLRAYTKDIPSRYAVAEKPFGMTTIGVRYIEFFVYVVHHIL